MRVTLRPLTLGEILDLTAQLYRENFLLFAGISAIYSGALLALSLVAIGIETALQAAQMVVALQWITRIAAGGSILVAFIAAGAAVAANNQAVGWLHLGRPASIRTAYGSILPRIGRYLWLMTITAFFVWLPLALLYVGYAIFLLAYVRPRGMFASPGIAARPEAAAGFLVASGIFALLLLPAVAYTIVMALRYALAVPACVMEGLKARQAIRRSIHLTRGSRGRIFVLGLLAIAIQVGLLLLTQTFFIVTEFRHHGAASPGLRILQQFTAFLTNTFVGPIYATGLTLFYFDQRVRQEGYDLERMMEAAGLSVAEAPTLASTDGDLQG